MVGPSDCTSFENLFDRLHDHNLLRGTICPLVPKPIFLNMKKVIPKSGKFCTHRLLFLFFFKKVMKVFVKFVSELYPYFKVFT